MNTYIYRADIWCEECAQRIMAELPKPKGYDPDYESSWDSDDFPKGPFSNGGGESDSPQHCAGCGLFLENPLTDDGRAYLKAALDNPGNSAVLAQWSDFYSV